MSAQSAAAGPHRPLTVADVLRTKDGGMPALVRFSPGMRAQSQQLKTFLLHNLYRHPQVMDMTAQARTVVRELFAAYTAAPTEMPPAFAAQQDLPRAVADYIAGMTDRFAVREHERLTGRRVLPA